MTFDYNTGKELKPGENQALYSTSTGQLLGAPAASPVTPYSSAVVNSKAAKADLDSIKTQHADLMTGMQNQAGLVANNQAQQNVAAQDQFAKEREAGQAAQKLQIEQQNADTKSQAAGVGTMQYDLDNGLAPGTSSSSSYRTPGQQLDEAQNERRAAAQEYQNQAKQVQQTVASIQNGTIPLSPDQNAQVVGLQQSYQKLIDQQVLVNKSGEGLANIRGFQKGAAEYDTAFQVKTIGSIITAGIGKVADLNVQMASAVSKLTQSLKDDNVKSIKDSFALYKDAYEERTNSIQKVVDEAQKQIDLVNKKTEDEQKAQIAEEKAVNDDIRSAVMDAGKGGAPRSVLEAAAKEKTLAGAVSVLGEYLNTTSGIIGEYTYYKRQAEAMGLKPMSFEEYQDEDANRKRLAASAAGLPASTLTRVTSVASQFDNNQSVKNYQTVAEGKSFLDSIPNNTQNPADQQGVIYAFAKIMDPNSVVREGEYNTVQKYAQSWADTFGFKAERIFSNSPFLTPQAIANMKATIKSKVDASKKSYDNIASEYEKKINKITGSDDGRDYLTDYAGGYGNADDLIRQHVDAKQTLDQFYMDNANQNPKLLETLDAFEQSGVKEDQVVEWLKKNGYLSFNSVGGDTKLASANVGGYDIGSYATDPNHEKNVSKIYSNIGEIATPEDADSYIKSIAPGSPILGSDVIEAAEKYGVSPEMILSIMQQDSSFGTAGKAVKTKNPGNVGNDDSGKTVDMKTWKNGVEAVAKNLMKRKINNLS